MPEVEKVLVQLFKTRGDQEGDDSDDQDDQGDETGDHCQETVVTVIPQSQAGLLL